MNKVIYLAILAAFMTAPLSAIADEIDAAETTLSQEANKPDYVSRLKEKYSLTDPQIEAMKNSKISTSQYAVVGALAKESGKPVEEILKMRTEDKMGWGKIAKQLGVEPRTIGQAVSGMHRKDEANANPNASVESKDERKEERRASKEERRKMHEEKKQERKEQRENRKEKKSH